MISPRGIVEVRLDADAHKREARAYPAALRFLWFGNEAVAYATNCKQMARC